MVSSLTYRNGLNSWYVVVINLLQLISLILQLLTQSSIRILSTHTSVHCNNCHPPQQQSFPLRFSPPHHTTTIVRPFFRDHPGEPVPETFWTLWCKGRFTEVDTPTIRLGASPSGLTSAHLHHPSIFYRPDALPAAQPTVSKH